MEQGKEAVQTARAYCWTFANAEFDEGRWQLRVAGQPVELELKPLEVLQYLLRHAGEAVTKEELLTSVWAGRVVVEAVLTNAIGKLRKALGDDGQDVVTTLPRVGYRLGVPVMRKAVEPLPPASRLEAGNAVPRRQNWHLETPLARTEGNEVWLARHTKTREARVFKFSLVGKGLAGLKREVTIARLLRDALGERDDYVRVLDWDFEEAPYFLESEYCGHSLDNWPEGGRFADVPLQQRLELFARAADAVAAAHGVGVLHKDLKPANLLVHDDADGPHLRVADFGSSRLFDSGVLDGLGITHLGLTRTQTISSDSGTPLYLAPEVVAGHSPSIRSDVYALGVTLYQMLVGDFRRPLAPGWEQDIDDPLLREDIAAAANGDPAKRLESASLLAGRIRSLEERRRQRALEQAVRERVEEGEKRLAKVRARRPWMIAAMAVLVLGLGVTGWLLQRAWISEREAIGQRDIAQALSRFVTEDILMAANPFESEKASLTMKEALGRASPRIEQRFSTQPELAAPLHEVVAQAYYQHSDYEDAAAHFQAAAELYGQLHGALSPEALLQKTLQAEALARKGRTASAQILLDEVADAIATVPASRRPMLRIHHGRALAWNYAQKGELTLAVAPLERALEELALLPEPDSTLEMSIMQALAMARSLTGMSSDDVLARYRQAMTRMRDEEDGVSMPQELSARYGALRLRILQGEERLIEKEYREVIAELIEVMGPRNESTLLAMHGLAHVHSKQEKWSECTRVSEQARQGLLELFGSTHLHPANTANTQAVCLLGEGRVEEAGALLVSTIETLDGESSGVAGFIKTALQINLGHVFAEQESWDKLPSLLHELRTNGAALLDAQPEARAGVDLAEGRLAAATGDVARARSLIEGSIEILSEKNPDDYWLIRLAQRELRKLA